MNITLENYEAYFLDYIEGNLSSAQKAELETFLAQNPALENELSHFDTFTIEPEICIFPDKNELKKITILNNQTIAFVENDLESAEIEALQLKMLSDSEFKKELLLFGHTKLVADSTILYQTKNTLKQKTILQKSVIYLSIAASVALFLLIFKPQNKYEINTITSTIKTVNISHQIVTNQGIKKEKSSTIIYKSQKSNAKIIAISLDTISIASIDFPQADTATLQPQNLLEEKNIVQTTTINKDEKLILSQNHVQEYSSIDEFVINKVKSKINIEKPTKVSLWNLLSQSIHKVGEFIGYDMNLEINHNDDNVENWAFESDKIKLLRK